MEISIFTDELIRSVSDAFLQDAVSIEDSLKGARPSGPVTEAEYERAVSTADATIRQRTMRFLKHTAPGNSDNTHGMAEEFVYDFCGSPRRLAGKETALADLIHEALKELALNELLKNLAPTVAVTHLESGEGRLSQISNLLLIKNPPLAKYEK